MLLLVKKLRGMQMKKILLVLLMGFSFQSCASDSYQQLPTVEYVDLNKYMGVWYSVSSLPQRFTKGCLYQSAEYKLENTNRVSVLNTCYKKNKTSDILGYATVDNTQTNADLSVYFRILWRLFKVSGDYKVLALDENYQFVMVGSEDRKSLWIMSRSKSMPEIQLNKFRVKAKQLGFKVEELKSSEFF